MSPLRRGAFLLALASAAALVAAPRAAAAQGTELSRADRLAIVYTSQLAFDERGEPLIKIGLTEGHESLRFSADTDVALQPLGPSGPEIVVPAGNSMTVTMHDGQAGEYLHRVIVERLDVSARDRVRDVAQRWQSDGVDASILQLGSVFAVDGQQFDTRAFAIATPPVGDRDAADRRADELSEEFGVETWVHSELQQYPGGVIELSGLPGDVRVRHRDLLWVRGTDETIFTVEDVAFDRGTRGEGRETRRFVGSLIFTADRTGQLALVNELSAERLVEGILPAEIYATAPTEALRAQAVAARSELLADLGVRHLADPYMTCADQRCQVYRGIDFEDSRASAAVRATRGQVLVHGNQIINAFFSANNGGFAAGNAETWGGEQRAYLPARFDGPNVPPEWSAGLDEQSVRAFLEHTPDAYANISSFGSGRYFRWQEEMTGAELTRAVARRYDVGTVTGLEILERSASGRVTRLRLTGRSGSVVIERELNVRRALGGLKSALFVIDLDSGSGGSVERVVFHGGGFGHGVGLCQSGAIGAAERGLSHRRILANYYPGTDLRELY